METPGASHPPGTFVTAPPVAAPASANPAPLSPTGCVATSWRTFWSNPWLGLAILLGIAIATALNSVPIIGWLVGLLFGPALYGGAARLAIKMVERRDPQIEDLLGGFSRWWRFLGAQLLQLLIFCVLLSPLIFLCVMIAILHREESLVVMAVLIGLSILLAPIYIWVGLRLGFVLFLLADSSRVVVLDSLSRSWNMTRGHFWRLLGLAALLLLLQFAGAVALGVGLLVTIPMMILGYAAAYSRLRPADLIDAPAAMSAPTPVPAPPPVT